MEKNRLEAFSDGVIAVIITIMVLELKVPHGIAFSDLRELIPVFISYVLSFLYTGIYWNNHHHMFHAVHRVDGPALWANLHLLFWLSLLPFATGWMAENHFALYPVILYGFILLMAAVAYYILVHALIRCPQQNPELLHAIGPDFKGRISVMLYALGMGLAFVHPWLGFAAYFCVAALWLVPDRRIEKNLHN
ncbi:MAG: hypothetical protein JWO78_2021 [Micavibrio sp.]|nr:hypothetical protein [Micavibrio sp.]